MLNVHSIETFGTSDGPGIRLVVFMQGCNIRCLYCHNPDTQALTNEHTKHVSVEDILDRLEKQRPYFKDKGGLTVSGGEPTLQASELLQLFREARLRGFHTALDTNGTIVSDSVKALYDETDLVILDVKHIDDHWHRKLTGASNVNTLKNAAYREETQRPMWLRYVLVPGWSDQVEHLKKWVEHFARYQSVERVEILPYHTLGVHKYQELERPYELADVQPPTTAQVEHARTLFEQYFKQVVIN